jgi:hypothetical protein
MEHALELEIAHAALEPHGIALDILSSGFVLFAFSQLEELGSIRDRLRCAIELSELGAQLGALAPELLRLVGLLPDRGVFQLTVDLFEPFFLVVVLKETP